VLKLPGSVYIEEDRFHRDVTASERRFAWARYTAMMTPGSEFTRDEVKHQQAIMDEKCPATFLEDHWLVENTGTVNDPDLAAASRPH
jgi:hypothetical protein